MSAILLTRRQLIRRQLRDRLEMCKPGIVVMSFAAVAIGAIAAGRGSAPLGLVLSVATAAALIAAASFTLNHLLEYSVDARMDRTSDRPLPTGRLSPIDALIQGLSLAFLGIAMPIMAGYHLAAILLAVIFASYVFVYTPMKTRSLWNTVVGAVPGALPPVVGWVAVTGSIDAGAIALFLILFFWQFPHFYAIAWLYREDYRRAGMKMLPALDSEDGMMTTRHMVGNALALLPASLLPTVVGLAGRSYMLGAALLGLGFLGATLGFALARTDKRAKQVFRVSLVYLPALLILLTLDLIKI